MAYHKGIGNKLESTKEEILADYERGATIAGLARKHQCSLTPVRLFLIRHGIAIRPSATPKKLAPDAEEIDRLYRAGATAAELADRFSVNRDTMSAWLSSHGLSRDTRLRKRTFFIEKAEDKALLAGLILGEGSIIIRGRGVRVVVVNQDAGILGWLAKFGGLLHWSSPRSSSPNPCCVWDVGGAVNVFHCLLAVHPYLLGKKLNLANAALNVLRGSYGLKGIP